MDPARKKQRTQEPDCDNDQNFDLSDSAESDKSGDVPIEFPSLVFEIFIQTTKDVRLLKLCRLVCKAWNISASSAMRTRSYIDLREDKPETENFMELIINRGLTPTPLPLPYQNVNLFAHTFTNDAFNSLIKRPTFALASLTYIQNVGNQLNQRQFEALLVSKGAQMKELHVSLVPRTTFDAEFLANENIHFPSLKRLKLHDYCYPNCCHIEFIEKIMTYATLEVIELDIKDVNILTNVLFTNDSLDAVKKLYLTLPPLSTEDWEFFQKLSLPALKVLHFKSLASGSRVEQAQHFHSFVYNVSATIEVLSSNVLSIGASPNCPKLQDISISHSKFKISRFTPTKFPSLKKIEIIGRASSWTCLENDFEVHEGVKSIAVLLMGPDSELQTFSDMYLPVFLTYLRRQFPHADDLSLNMRPFSGATFRDINHFFPDLKKLTVWGPTDFTSISGMHLNIINDYLEAGWPIDRVPRRSSILNFQALESICFGPECRVTSEFITYCLSRIPSLKTVEFYWNANISAQEVRDNLGHLENVVINRKSRSEYREVMDNLYSMLNNVRIV